MVERINVLKVNGANVSPTKENQKQRSDGSKNSSRGGSSKLRQAGANVLDDDPFGLFGDISKRSYSATRKRRQDFEESKGAAQTMPLYEQQAGATLRSNSQRQGAAREVFHVMTGIPTEKRV